MAGRQWCTSPGYAYVHESVADAFAAETKKALVELFGNDPKSNVDYSRIINARTVDRLASLIDRQGDRRWQIDAMRTTSILRFSIRHLDDKVMEDEVFGPSCRSDL